MCIINFIFPNLVRTQLVLFDKHYRCTVHLENLFEARLVTNRPVVLLCSKETTKASVECDEFGGIISIFLVLQNIRFCIHYSNDLLCIVTRIKTRNIQRNRLYYIVSGYIRLLVNFIVSTAIQQQYQNTTSIKVECEYTSDMNVSTMQPGL